MSPEQAKGRPADKRSDVWAFGCVLYEMLTGRRTFHGENVTDTLAAVLRGEPDWTVLPSDVPGNLRMLVRGCLEKDRGRRIGDLAAARFVLDQPASITPVAAAAPPAPRRRWQSVAAIAAAVLLTATLAGVAAWRVKPAGPSTPVARFSFSLADVPQATAFSSRFRLTAPSWPMLPTGACSCVLLPSSRLVRSPARKIGWSFPTRHFRQMGAPSRSIPGRTEL